MANLRIFLASALILLAVLSGCQSPSPSTAPNQLAPSAAPETMANPPAPGFNAAASDPEAIRIADEVMVAMGGRKAWDDTRFIGWTFFGRRHLLWDKNTGRVRIDVPSEKTVYLVNVWRDTGRVMLRGEEVTQPDSLTKYVGRGKSIWINDSYWLVMPFKLKDSGVTLRYIGEDTTQAGKPADILQLTFENVGDTPQNRYLVYVDKTSRLVTQWSYFANAGDAKPGFSLPWENYQRKGAILLSGGRGSRSLTDIEVMETVPDQAFESFDFQLSR